MLPILHIVNIFLFISHMIVLDINFILYNELKVGDNMTFGEKLNNILEDRDISQKSFAASLNIAPSTLNGYIKDRRQPDFETLKSIAFVLNVSIDFLPDYNSNNIKLTLNELSLIAKIRKMDNAQREIIYDLVNVIDKKS